MPEPKKTAPKKAPSRINVIMRVSCAVDRGFYNAGSAAALPAKIAKSLIESNKAVMKRG